VLFLSRISAGRGVGLVVALSRRLADLAGTARMRIIGDRTPWSDYRTLDEPNPDITCYEGPMRAERLVDARARGSADPAEPARVIRVDGRRGARTRHTGGGGR
jgi:hypothetical protein